MPSPNCDPANFGGIQAFARTVVHVGVTTFAEVLKAKMHRNEPAPQTPFEDCLHDFETRVVAASFETMTVALPEWAIELGVTLPCTEQDLKLAFRRRAFETHPDRPGGSHQAFLRVQAIFEKAVREYRTPHHETPSCVRACNKYGAILFGKSVQRPSRGTYG